MCDDEAKHRLIELLKGRCLDSIADSEIIVGAFKQMGLEFDGELRTFLDSYVSILQLHIDLL